MSQMLVWHFISLISYLSVSFQYFQKFPFIWTLLSIEHVIVCPYSLKVHSPLRCHMITSEAQWYDQAMFADEMHIVHMLVDTSSKRPLHSNIKASLAFSLSSRSGSVSHHKTQLWINFWKNAYENEDIEWQSTHSDHSVLQIDNSYIASLTCQREISLLDIFFSRFASNNW